MKGLLLGLLLASTMIGHPVVAQWVVEASAGGTEHDAVAASAATRSAALGVRRGGHRWGYLVAGAPLDSAGLPWGAAGVGARLARSGEPVELGVDVAGEGYAYRERSLGANGGGLVVGLLPFVAWTRNAARLQVGTGVRSHLATFDGWSSSRTVSETRVALATAPAAPLIVELWGRYLRAPEGGYPFAGAAAELVRGSAALSVHGGWWVSAAGEPAEWGARARLSVGRRTELFVGVEQQATDPLYRNDARRSWTVGAAHALGPRLLSPSDVTGAPVTSAGRVEISIPVRDSPEPPALAGDFNGWRPVPMSRRGDRWTASLTLAPGVYRYAFRHADGRWFVPASTPGRVDDGFGGESAVLVVGRTAAP